MAQLQKPLGMELIYHALLDDLWNILKQFYALMEYCDNLPSRLVKLIGFFVHRITRVFGDGVLDSFPREGGSE